MLRKLNSRYRQFVYRNRYDRPALVLAASALYHGTTLVCFLLLIAAIFYLIL